MSTVSAGRVMPLPKGAYDATTTYHVLDIVTYNNSSYIAKGTTTGNVPTNTTYWQLFASGSAVGSLNDIGDVSIASAADGEVLMWDDTAGKWVNGTAASGGLLPHIIVISDTGSTVTLVKGQTTIAATETTTGHFEADVTDYGTWTIHSVLSGDDATTSLNVDDVKIYTVDDSHFNASITVSYPSAATCSLSATGLTPVYATGSPFTFIVHSAATYTLTATINGTSKTKTVTITTSGQTETETFLIDGSTVTPTDDVATWLECAYIWDKNYTTLAEVIADSETLLALISDNNAVDYMARSYEFASYTGIGNNLVPYPYSESTKTENGITWTNNGDGSVKVTGTAGATTVFECQNSSGAFNLSAGTYTATSGLGIIPSGVALWVTGSDGLTKFAELTSNEPRKTFTLSGTTAIRVRLRVEASTALGSTGITFIPMIRVASDLTSDPLSMLYIGQYNYCADTLLERNRNLIPYPYHETSKTDSGIAFTDTGNGIVKATGTASTSIAFYCSSDGSGGKFYIPAGTYVLSGCPSGGGQSTYALRVRHSGAVDGIDYGSGATLTFSEETLVEISCLVYSGTALPTDGIEFHPMIRLATDTDDTWEPYMPWARAICESELFELVLTNLVPQMTDNTHPSGEAFGSSKFNDDIWDYHNITLDNGDGWYPYGDNRYETGEYIGYKFSSATRAFRIDVFYEEKTVIAKVKLQGSLDGTNWVDISSVVELSYPSIKEIPFNITDSTAYLYYRVYVVECTARCDGYTNGLIVLRIKIFGRSDVTAPSSRTLKTFATASDEEILEMVCKADRGEIDLDDDAGWAVSQEHSVDLCYTIRQITDKYEVGESQPAQTVTLVLMHKGLYELVNPVLDTSKQTRNTCSFIAGMKDNLLESGKMVNSSVAQDEYINSWNGCPRRSWCNYGFRNALPPALRAAFKQFKTITASSYAGSSNTVSDDYFALPAEKEVFGRVNGTTYWSPSIEANALTQFSWYGTSANRSKQNGNYNRWFERSPSIGEVYGRRICISEGYNVSTPIPSQSYDAVIGISPFGCL